MEWGHTGFALLSVRLSIDKVSGTLKKKTFWENSIYFVPGIYLNGVGLLTPIHFRVPVLNLGPLVAKYLFKNGFYMIFKKNISLIHLIPSIQPYAVSLLTPTHFGVPTINCGCVEAKYLPEKGNWNFVAPWPSWGQNYAVILRKQSFPEGFPPVLHPQWLQNRNLYWVFLDKAGSYQRGDI